MALEDATLTEIKKRQRLATSIVILSQGVPFIHAGQEFYRTKMGVENSYKSPDSINKIDWNLVDQNQHDIAYFKELLRLRKKYDVFRLTAPSKIRDCVTIHINELGTIQYHLKDMDTELIVIFKHTKELETIEFDGRYNLIFDGEERSRKIVTSLQINDISTYILKRK